MPPRPVKGRDVQSADSLLRPLLRKTAHVHYSKQSAERREEIRKSFYNLDESQDGRISLQEFLASTGETQSSGSGRVIAKIFSYVDEDKSGFLEFDEFLVLTFIMESGFQICDACLSPVVMAGYTCKTCWSQRRISGQEAHDTYDLCSSCYVSAAAIDHPASHQLVDTNNMYHYLLTNSAAEDCTVKEKQVQCCICEEYHTTDIEGLLVDGKNHVVQRRGSSSQEFVCEWCASYMCTGCGKYFSEPSYHDVKTNQWLRRDLCCGVCNEEENYQPSVDSLLELMEKSDIPNKCSTCAKNFKNGTLGKKNQVESSIDITMADLITSQMANNLLLQQSYFNATMLGLIG